MQLDGLSCGILYRSRQRFGIKGAGVSFFLYQRHFRPFRGKHFNILAHPTCRVRQPDNDGKQFRDIRQFIVHSSHRIFRVLRGRTGDRGGSQFKPLLGTVLKHQFGFQRSVGPHHESKRTGRLRHQSHLPLVRHISSLGAYFQRQRRVAVEVIVGRIVVQFHIFFPVRHFQVHFQAHRVCLGDFDGIAVVVVHLDVSAHPVHHLLERNLIHYRLGFRHIDVIHSFQNQITSVVLKAGPGVEGALSDIKFRIGSRRLMLHIGLYLALGICNQLTIRFVFCF